MPEMEREGQGKLVPKIWGFYTENCGTGKFSKNRKFNREGMEI